MSLLDFLNEKVDLVLTFPINLFVPLPKCIPSGGLLFVQLDEIRASYILLPSLLNNRMASIVSKPSCFKSERAVDEGGLGVGVKEDRSMIRLYGS